MSFQLCSRLEACIKLGPSVSDGGGVRQACEHAVKVFHALGGHIEEKECGTDC